MELLELKHLVYALLILLVGIGLKLCAILDDYITNKITDRWWK